MAGRTDKPKSPETLAVKVVSTNRRARHEYQILETYECGLALQGHEVKSIREGRVNIQDGHAVFRGNEAFVENVHITPYSHGSFAMCDRSEKFGSFFSNRAEKQARIRPRFRMATRIICSYSQRQPSP